MSASSLVFLYPGQGGYSRDLLARLAAGSPTARDAIATVTEVARAELFLDMSPLLREGGPDLPELLDRAPAVLQMAIYAASVASALELADAAVTPVMHIGHSLGEIAALTAAGVCSVADGARIVARRIRVLSQIPCSSGFMLDVSTGPETAQRLLAFLGDPQVAIAGVNGVSQVVLAGAAAPMERAVAVLGAAGISATRLPAPLPFHSPVLQPAVAALEASLPDIAWSAPSVPVYSPIEGRWYEDGDDFPALLARHLVRPFDFAGAVKRAAAEGGQLFVECGGRQTLTGLVERTLSGQAGWTAVTTDQQFPKGTEMATIARMAAAEDPGQTREKLRSILDGISAPGVFERFWDADGSRLFAQLRESYRKYRVGRRPATPAVQATSPAPNGSAAPVAAAPAVAPSSPAPSPGATAPVPATSAPPVPASTAAASAPSAEPAAVNESARTAPTPIGRDQVFAELARLYGEALEYPSEVFDADTELEAELGVDSVKQTDLLGRVAKRYQLPTPSAGFRIIDYPTFGHVVELVLAAGGRNG